MISLSDRIHGCFLGKSIGGTLGMPYEGRQKYLSLRFYDPVPEHTVPNDDLDLQLVWLQHLHEVGPAINSDVLAGAWSDHINAHVDEYGVALWNMRRGLKPPLTGWHNNWFQNGMGAAIRSEVWATVCAGRPAAAAHYAWQDSRVDHAGDGIYAEVFLAALEAELYRGSSIVQGIERGLSFLPASSPLRQLLEKIRGWHAAGKNYDDCRDAVMKAGGSTNFADCLMNLAFILVGLLYGNGRFADSILAAVNCGQDTDCTGATTGSCLGILLGASGIPEEWKRPVGEEVAMGDYIRGVRPPADLPDLCAQLTKLQADFAAAALPELPAPFTIPPVAGDISDNIPWRINGRTVTVPWMQMPVADHAKFNGGSLYLSTCVRSNTNRAVQLLVCSPGMFRACFDDQRLGTWGEQSDIVPAFHRVRGGRVFNVSLTAGQTHRLVIELLPTTPVPDLWVAFSDLDHRYLDDLVYVEDKSQPNHRHAIESLEKPR